MKNHIATIALLIPFLFGCVNSTKSRDDSDQKTKDIEIVKEINSDDSIAVEMEKAKMKIEKSSHELDSLLKEL